MVALNTPVCNFDWPAPDFKLPDGNGKTYDLRELKGDKGTLIVFICNHCPYVKSIIDDFVATARLLQENKVNVVAISSNDVVTYPEDAPDKMVEFAETHQFTFPYLYDETQKVAKQYGAICTPDLFGFNKDLKLQYRGRFDARGRENVSGNAKDNDLAKAMLQIAATGRGPQEQIPSIGCSIKWK